MSGNLSFSKHHRRVTSASAAAGGGGGGTVSSSGPSGMNNSALNASTVLSSLNSTIVNQTMDDKNLEVLNDFS
jgi:hypothetical protein